eukprot:CAMPEP_0201681056 /NCGR_PEP_ID=MMETSP0494-20130426/50912_1 /ASSEMBLY_ACC=CAM_ASM_000839 /TAXON_ID=420259 /ORGANISM="Thalassiosira gravida, Strain GMp14c1" /LENGTH=121 /DNA_ID=CAMNT_0048164787 /DNA_START=370 /DNA_END=735 /DNA_ORIENTATION=-
MENKKIELQTCFGSVVNQQNTTVNEKIELQTRFDSVMNPKNTMENEKIELSVESENIMIKSNYEELQSCFDKSSTPRRKGTHVIIVDMLQRIKFLDHFEVINITALMKRAGMKRSEIPKIK